MYGRYSIVDFAWIVMAVWVTIIPLFAVVMVSDHIEINIENNYLDELKQCELDLKNTQPICPDVKCESSNNVLPFVWGMILAFGIVQLTEYMQKKNSKKKKAVKTGKGEKK